jgi:hypothetical protein
VSMSGPRQAEALKNRWCDYPAFGVAGRID